MMIGENDLAFEGKISVTEDDAVSVVVPFFNRARFLKRLLDSVEKQKYRTSRVFIVDNGSNRENAEQAWKIISQHRLGERCIFISTLKRGNANYARNLGFLLAKTEYVAYLDSDDWWEPDHLKQSIDKLKSSGKAGSYSGHHVYTKYGRHTNRSLNVDNVGSPVELFFGGSGGVAQSSSFVVSKPLVSGLVEWDENLRRSQDHDYFISIQLNTRGWVFCQDPHYCIDWQEGGTQGAVDGASIIYFYKKWSFLFSDRLADRFFIRYLTACQLRGMGNDLRVFQGEYRQRFPMSISRRLVSSRVSVFCLAFIMILKRKIRRA